MSAVTLAAAALVVLCAGWVQASVGIGYAMIAAPLLLLIHPAFGADTVLVSVLGVALPMAWVGRQLVNRPGLAALMVGLALGSLTAILGIPFLPASRDAVLGTIVLLAAGATMLGLRPPNGRAAAGAVGAVAGVMGTVSGVHGPALALAFARMPLAEARATVASIFVVACTASLALRALSGALEVPSVLWGLAFGGVAALGWGLARVVRLPARPARRLSLALVVASGGVLVLRGLS